MIQAGRAATEGRLVQVERGAWVTTLLGRYVGRVLDLDGDKVRVRWQAHLEARPGTTWESCESVASLKPAILARVDEGGWIRAGYQSEEEADPWAPGVGRTNSLLGPGWHRNLVRLDPKAAM